MPRRGDRGGAATRSRISEVATSLFLERGFDDVTVSDVALAAGVAKVTVFHYFPRKEDLLLDRAPDAVEVFRRALAGRPEAIGPLDAIRMEVLRLVDEDHPLVGMHPNAVPFFRMIGASPALTDRARELVSQTQTDLAERLRADTAIITDPDLLAAFIIMAIQVAVVRVARQRLAGETLDQVRPGHRAYLAAAFASIQTGLRAPAPSRCDLPYQVS